MMNETEYEKLLSWAKKRNYYLNPKLKYDIIDGVGGIVTNEDIESDEVLYSGPGQLLNNHLDKPFNKVEYLCDIIREYKKGKDSDIHPIFSAFQSNEELQNTSIYYSPEEELDMLKNDISVTAYNMAIIYRAEIDEMVKVISETLNDGTDKDIILFVLLNSERRSWNGTGFNPILDLFNHNNTYGNNRCQVDSNEYILGARDRYHKGEQVYDSYGTLDLYKLICTYGFFDETDTHIIDIAPRLTFDWAEPISDDLLNNFPIRKFSVDGVDKFQLTGTGYYISEFGPSAKFINFINTLSKVWKGELLKDKKAIDVVTITNVRMWSTLFKNSTFLSERKTGNVIDPNKLPNRIKPFGFAAKKELNILNNLEAWVIASSHLLPEETNNRIAKKYLDSKK